MPTQSRNVSSRNRGGVKIVKEVVIPAGVTGDVVANLEDGMEITDIHLLKTVAAGGGAGTIQAKNGANAITDAMDIDVADETIVRAATLDDAGRTFRKGQNITFTRTRTGSTDESCIAVIEGFKL